MARQITIPAPDWSKVEGTRAIIPVKVDWPELQLTESEIMVNAIAAAHGDVPPYPDLSIIEIVIQRPITSCSVCQEPVVDGEFCTAHHTAEYGDG